MKKRIFAVMALAAALCACNKEQLFDVEQIEEFASPLIFTATMEGAPVSKATFDNSAKCASWEVGDQVNINGFSYEANAAGTTTMFNRVATNQPREIRPVFVSTTTPDSFNNSNPPSNLVDAAGTETRWCAHTDHKVSGVWNIVVSTTQASILKTIKLWNADNQTYSGRRWKSIKVYGSSSSQSGWTELKSIENLNLAINNRGFAGEVEINATKEYTFYKIDVLENEGNAYMQMSDMKFVVTIDGNIRPSFVSSTDIGSYENHPASNLVDAAGTSTQWIADKSQRTEGENVWNIVVSTGSNTLLKTIKLWNADNQTNPGRRWKEITLAGRMSSGDPWRIINASDDLTDLKLEKNNYGLAGEIKINSAQPYTLYKINVLDNEGDNYMQMSDMTFGVEPAAPYHAYFPASLYNGEQTVLPASISETWAEGKFNMPMYAQGSSPELQFKNLCGVLKITVKNDVMPKVKSIRISSLNKATSGAFTVSNNAAVLDSPDAASNTVTVTYTDAVSTSAEGTVFYIAIPPQSYRALRIELSADGNDFTKLMTTKKNVEITVTRSKIYPITFSMDDLTTGMEIATINGSEVYVPWVQLWKDGPKFAKFNVGAEYNNESDYGSYLRFVQFITNESYSWGNKWRVPKSSELSALMANCNSIWTTISGTPGRLYTGNGEYSNNSIFLPAAGYYNGPLEAQFAQLLDKDTHGKYLSSTSKSSTTLGPFELYCLVFTSSNQNIDFDYATCNLSIRPVLAE